jgi:predicted RNase H-like nuclease (RuvC/YqgF family)
MLYYSIYTMKNITTLLKTLEANIKKQERETKRLNKQIAKINNELPVDKKRKFESITNGLLKSINSSDKLLSNQTKNIKNLGAEIKVNKKAFKAQPQMYNLEIAVLWLRTKIRNEPEDTEI